MRRDDINIEFTPADIKTHDMYVPPKMPVEDMTDRQLMRGMCAKSRGFLSACAKCPARCSFGRELIRRVVGGSKQKTDSV